MAKSPNSPISDDIGDQPAAEIAATEVTKPSKVKAAKAKGAQKKRGRPAKAKAEAPAAEKPAKRRGRPPGSKSKKSKVSKAPKAKVAKAPKAPKATGALGSALKKKIAADGLSLSAAAVAIGVAVPGLRRILTGKAKANARTMAKYEAFLGGKSAPIAKAKKAKGKPGRPAGRRPGRPAAAVVRGGLAGALAVIKQALETKAPEVEVDKLAAKVQSAPKRVRTVIEAMLALV